MDILIFGAHPDDIELCCGGTVKKLTNDGHSVTLVDLTHGEMGTRGTPELRQKEAEKASQLLGVENRMNIGLPDGGLHNNAEYRIPIIKVIRTFQPHICFITAPEDRHPDHTHATELLIDAIYFSGLKNIETLDDENKPQEKWRPHHVLHYMQDRPFEPDLVIDITETLQDKIDAVLAYGSQFNVPDEQGEETYISSSRFFKNIEARARHYGHLIGTEFGEPFKYQGGPIPVQDFSLFEQSAPKR